MAMANDSRYNASDSVQLRFILMDLEIKFTKGKFIVLVERERSS